MGAVDRIVRSPISLDDEGYLTEREAALKQRRITRTHVFGSLVGLLDLHRTIQTGMRGGDGAALVSLPTPKPTPRPDPNRAVAAADRSSPHRHPRPAEQRVRAMRRAASVWQRWRRMAFFLFRRGIEALARRSDRHPYEADGADRVRAMFASNPPAPSPDREPGCPGGAGRRPIATDLGDRPGGPTPPSWG